MRLLHCLVDIGVELTVWLLERQQSGADACTLVPSQMQVKQMYDCWSRVVVLQASDHDCFCMQVTVQQHSCITGMGSA